MWKGKAVVADDMVNGTGKLFKYRAGLSEFFLVILLTPFDQVAELEQKINVVLFAVFEPGSKLCGS